MSRGGRRIKWGSEPTTTSNLDGIWGLNEINNLIGQTKWPRGPVAPTGLSATAGNTQLLFSWTAPATTHGTITNYLVEYTPSGGSASYVLTNSTGTSYTLTGLTNGTAYTVRVAAVNFTAGDYSSAVTATPNNILVTGGTVTTPGDGFKYHTFNNSGTLAISVANLTGAEVLVVGGGGSGGHDWAGGGGGGGGVLYLTNQTINIGSYAVTVASQSALNANGGSSSIGSLYVATGGSRPTVGGGYTQDGGTSGFPTTTSNSVGNSGGVALREWDSRVSGGGGGGAGGNGQNGQTNQTCPVGGSGRTVFGVTYGRGGDGTTADNIDNWRCTTRVDGPANSGQGGSGGDRGGWLALGGRIGTGGSGRVIIRYPSA